MRNSECAHNEKFRRTKKEPLIFSGGRIWDEAKNLQLLEQIAPKLHWPLQIANGKIESKDIAAQLARAAIYAAPARYEPFGLGILEAALSGCALVLGDIASLRENWDGAAIFLPPNDSAAWRETLNSLAADSRRRKRLADNAQARARKFSPEKMAAAYLVIYRKLLREVSDTLQLQPADAA